MLVQQLRKDKQLLLLRSLDPLTIKELAPYPPYPLSPRKNRLNADKLCGEPQRALPHVRIGEPARQPLVEHDRCPTFWSGGQPTCRVEVGVDGAGRGGTGALVGAHLLRSHVRQHIPRKPTLVASGAAGTTSTACDVEWRGCC